MELEFNQQLTGAKTTVLEIVRDIALQDWKLESNKDGFIVHTKVNPANKLNINRIETVAQVNIESLAKLLSDHTKRKEYDDKIAECKILKEINPTTKITYIRGVSPMMMVDARDFVLLTHLEKIENGFVLVAKSVHFNEEPPVQKGVVRGEVHFNAWVFTEQPDKKVKIVFISHMDPKGDLPKAVTNNQYKNQIEQIKKAIAHANKI